MKNNLVSIAILFLLLVGISGCTAIGGIFKTGIGVGMFIVVLVIVILLIIFGRKK